MADVIRQDLFRIEGAVGALAGLYRVAIAPDSASRMLPQLRFVKQDQPESDHYDQYLQAIVGSVAYRYMSDGDIVHLDGSGNLKVILAHSANSNSLLFTEQCDNRCTFCSQPPKIHDDDWLVGHAATALIEFNTPNVVGITGGEPLLVPQKFLSFLGSLNAADCRTPLHVLTNGRSLKDRNFVETLAECLSDRKVLFGIPLYAAQASVHDALVGAVGAWDETISGLINLGSVGIPIELRFIPVQGNVSELVPTVELAGRCVAGIQHIAVMNLEPYGWGKRNWEKLYLPPPHYFKELADAIRMAQKCGLAIELYNYPRCHLEKGLWPHSVKSISDWKNYFPAECYGCIFRGECCGYFQSAKGQYLDAPRPFYE